MVAGEICCLSDAGACKSSRRGRRPIPNEVTWAARLRHCGDAVPPAVGLVVRIVEVLEHVRIGGWWWRERQTRPVLQILRRGEEYRLAARTPAVVVFAEVHHVLPSCIPQDRATPQPNGPRVLAEQHALIHEVHAVGGRRAAHPVPRCPWVWWEWLQPCGGTRADKLCTRK